VATPTIDHVLIADADATRALTISRWIQINHKIQFPEFNDPLLSLDQLRNSVSRRPRGGRKNGPKLDQVACTIFALNSNRSGWDAVGDEEATLGTLSYLYRKCLIGSPPYKAGPILILGRQSRAWMTDQEQLGLKLTGLPGVRYVRLPERMEGDLGVFVARQLECTIIKWHQCLRTHPDTIDHLLRKRNELIAEGLFKAIRKRSRVLVHTYNSLLTAETFSSLQSDRSWADIDALAIYADAHLSHSSSRQVPTQFQDTLKSYYETVDEAFEQKDRNSLSKALQKVTTSLSQLESLISWWESLMAWSSLAVTHQHQRLEAVIVDDEKNFSRGLSNALESKRVKDELQALLGRDLTIATSIIPIEPDAKPERVLKELRERKLHHVDVIAGSPVLIFQDLILHGQADFGLRVIRRLKSRYPWIRVIAVTSREKARFEILDAGADLYLNKSDLVKEGYGLEQHVDEDKLARVLGAALSPSPVLSIGDSVPSMAECFKLLCERYWLNPMPISINDQSIQTVAECLPLESGIPRLLLVHNQELSYESMIRQVHIAREICLRFPELVLIIWRPHFDSTTDERLQVLIQGWFEIWGKWIPNYASRVLPIDRPATVGIRPPLQNGTASATKVLDLMFSSEELLAAESLLRRSAPLPNLAAYNFYVPRRMTPEGATGPMAAPTDVETDVADKIATRFGGSSVSLLHGRWIGDKGTADFDTIVAIESFAPVTRANRAFANEIVEEIRVRHGEEAVLQIERPVSVVSRDDQPEVFYLPAGLSDEYGTIDGACLLNEIFAPESLVPNNVNVTLS
jgi:CheY-like chemotaxis protein